MKYILVLWMVASAAMSQAQESNALYQKVMDIVLNTPEVKSLNTERFTYSKESISFINNAYAFHLEDPSLRFIDYDFDNYLGHFYQPVHIEAFQNLREKRRAKHIFYVSETEQNHFIIELLSFKRNKRAKYPKFYQGASYSFLFKKISDTEVQFLRAIRIVNN